MKRPIFVSIASLLLILIVVSPSLVAAQGLVPCGNPGQKECEFNDLMIMLNSIIQFLMYQVAVPLAALAFMYSGAKIVINQNKDEAWTSAKENFANVFKGFGIILVAFILVKFILYTFLNTEYYNFVQFLFAF